jgi:hypothetical protein
LPSKILPVSDASISGSAPIYIVTKQYLAVTKQYLAAAGVIQAPAMKNRTRAGPSGKCLEDRIANVFCESQAA